MEQRHRPREPCWVKCSICYFLFTLFMTLIVLVLWYFPPTKTINKSDMNQTSQVVNETQLRPKRDIHSDLYQTDNLKKCITPTCNCSRLEIQPGLIVGSSTAAVCLPETGNYSVFVPCKSLVVITAFHRVPTTVSPTDCTVKTKWTLTPARNSRDPPVSVPVIPAVGGVWLLYGFEGPSRIAQTKKTIITSQCKEWNIKVDTSSYTFSIAVCRVKNLTKPIPNGIGQQMGMKVKELTADHMMGIATGVTGELNNWLILAEQAGKAAKEDCVVCMKPRPIARVVPIPVPVDSLYTVLTNMTLHGNYSRYDEAFPLTPPTVQGPIFHTTVPTSLNFTCVNFTSTKPQEAVGEINQAYCKEVININGSQPLIPRSDVYYWCKQNRLRGMVIANSTGLCAVVNVIIPVKIYPLSANDILNATIPPLIKRSHLVKREVVKPWMKDDPTYIDSIGVPRGVPNEYKLVDQIATGFENIPLLCAIFPVTPNKNVDRINYVHYNVQRLGNYTYEGFQAIHEQLEATSLTAFQNRIALDMLLAEKGGVCSLFPDGSCCTYIPLHTAPDGRLTQILKKLQMFNERLKDQSGVDQSMWDWLDVFGKYKDLVKSALLSIAIFAALLIVLGCCCIPCLRGFINKLVDRAVAPVQQALMDEQVKLLSFDQEEDYQEEDYPYKRKDSPLVPQV